MYPWKEVLEMMNPSHGCYTDVDRAAGDCIPACLPDIMRGKYGTILLNWKRKKEERGMEDDQLQLEQARADADESEQ